MTQTPLGLMDIRNCRAEPHGTPTLLGYVNLKRLPIHGIPRHFLGTKPAPIVQQPSTLGKHERNPIRLHRHTKLPRKTPSHASGTRLCIIGTLTIPWNIVLSCGNQTSAKKQHSFKFTGTQISKQGTLLLCDTLRLHRVAQTTMTQRDHL